MGIEPGTTFDILLHSLRINNRKGVEDRGLDWIVAQSASQSTSAVGNDRAPTKHTIDSSSASVHGVWFSAHRVQLRTHIPKSIATTKTWSLQPNISKLVKYKASRLHSQMLFLFQLSFLVLSSSFRVFGSERLDEHRSVFV